MDSKPYRITAIFNHCFLIVSFALLSGCAIDSYVSIRNVFSPKKTETAPEIQTGAKVSFTDQSFNGNMQFKIDRKVIDRSKLVYLTPGEHEFIANLNAGAVGVGKSIVAGTGKAVGEASAVPCATWAATPAGWVYLFPLAITCPIALITLPFYANGDEAPLCKSIKWAMKLEDAHQYLIDLDWSSYPPSIRLTDQTKKEETPYYFECIDGKPQ